MTSLITIGIDVGDRFSHICVLAADGSVAEELRLRTTKPGIERGLAPWPGARVIVETGPHSGWMGRLLQATGYDVIVAHAGQIKLITQSNRKNDRFDAEQLARLGRMDKKLLRPVAIRCEQRARDITVLRAREAIVRMRTSSINEVRGVAKSLGIHLPACSSTCFAKRVRREIPQEAIFGGLPEMLDVIQSLTEHADALEKQIEQTCKDRYPETVSMRQVAGVGPITALTFALTIGDAPRFTRSRSVGSYLGLCPAQRDSGQKRSQLSITRSGDQRLRRLLVQAAHYVMGPFGPDTELRRMGMRLAARGGKAVKKRAVVAVARKLAVLLHRLWISGEEYQPLGYSGEVQAA